MAEQQQRWTAARRAPLSMGLSGKDTGEGYHALLQGIFPTQGLSPLLMSSVLAEGLFTTSATWEALFLHRKQGNSHPRARPSGSLPGDSLSSSFVTSMSPDFCSPRE